jgi:hypothetical protein
MADPRGVTTQFSRGLLEKLIYEDILPRASPQTKLQPIGDTSYGFLGPSAARPTSLIPQSPAEAPAEAPANDNSLEEVASLISKEDNVPADWLIYNVINPMAWHESATTMDPAKVQFNDGPGRGMLQFEGRRGYRKVIKVGSETDVDEDGQDLKKTKLGQDSFDTAIKRAKNFYTKKNKRVPDWITGVKKGEDARSLTSNQQRALGLLNIKMQKTSDFKKLHKNFNEDTLTKFWKKYHHKGSSKETKKVSNDRKENFKSLLKSFQKSAYSSGSLGFPPTSPPQPNPRRKPNPNLGNAYLKQNKIAAFRR